jgi:hypothetical protein
MKIWQAMTALPDRRWELQFLSLLALFLFLQSHCCLLRLLFAQWHFLWWQSLWVVFALSSLKKCAGPSASQCFPRNICRHSSFVAVAAALRVVRVALTAAAAAAVVAAVAGPAAAVSSEPPPLPLGHCAEEEEESFPNAAASQSLLDPGPWTHPCDLRLSLREGLLLLGVFLLLFCLGERRRRPAVVAVLLLLLIVVVAGALRAVC